LDQVFKMGQTIKRRKGYLVKKGIFALMLLGAWGMLFPSGLRAQTPLLFDDIGCGPRAIAMGQAFTAVADDAAAAYYNPAGLTQINTHLEFSMGYQYSKPKIYMKINDNDGNSYYPHPYLEQRDPNRSEDISTSGIFVGIASNFRHLSVFDNPPSFMRNIAFGFVLFNTLPEANTFWNPQRKQDPYHLRYNYGYCLMSMAISTAYRINDYVSIGAGIMPRMDTFQNTLRSYVDTAKMINQPLDAFRLRFKTNVELSVSWILGIMIHPPIFGLEDELTLGLTYRRQVSGYYGTGYNSTRAVTFNEVNCDKNLFFPGEIR